MMKKLSIIFTAVLGLFMLSGCTLPSDFFTVDITIDFDEMGGSEINNIVVARGSVILPEEVPTKEGYVFDGWYLDENYNYEASFTSGIDDDLTLYAKWVDENDIYSIDDIRAIINDYLSQNDLTIADQTTVQEIVTDIITNGDYIDEQSILDLVLAEIDVMTLFNTQVTKLLTDVSKSVVFVEAYNAFSTAAATGSGVIYRHSGNAYYVLTNHHVIDGFSNFKITVFGQNGNVDISNNYIDLLHFNIAHDIAVLRFTSSEQFDVLPFADMADIQVGELVFAVGSPLDLPNTSTMGIISAINREVVYSEGGSNTNTTAIQHDAAINPGNSGGALVNIYGELVGINFLSYVDETVGEGIEGLHFAIQIDVIKALLQSWGISP